MKAAGLVYGLPPIGGGSSKRPIKFVRSIRSRPFSPKPVATIPKIKAVAKLAETLGKTVTAISVDVDGGFTVATADPEKTEKASFWDKVLSNGQT